MNEEEMQEQAKRMLKRAMKEGRWYPRRHMAVALFIFLPIFGLLILLIILATGGLEPTVR